MKKLLSIALFFLFVLNFYSCQKEKIVPVNQLHDSTVESDFEYNSNNRDLEDSSVDTDVLSVTDPDEDEDFDGDK